MISVKIFQSFCLAIFLLGIVVGCNNMEQVQKKSDSTSSPSDQKTESVNDQPSNDASQIDWISLREDFSAPNKSKKTDIELFSIKNAQNEQNSVYTGIVQGYRVQIETTRNLAQADSLKNLFNYKMQQLNAAFQPESYIIYKPPYYRIRVGDFNDRSRALEYTRYLKRYYPSCWVVADQIDPKFIPNDGVSLNPADKATVIPQDSTSNRTPSPY